MEPNTVPPETDLVIEHPEPNFQDHDWHQEGYTLICTSCPQYTRHAVNLPPGKMLVGNRGDWSLVMEGGLAKQT